MNAIRLLVYSIMMAAVCATVGCSKSSSPVPPAPLTKKIANPVLPSKPIPSTTSVTASSSSVKTTDAPVVPKPVVAMTPAVTPTLPLKQAEASLAATPDLSLTSTVTGSIPAKSPDSLPIYTYNPEGRRDPFMTFLQGASADKKIKTAIPLLNYSLSDLKLVAVMVLKKHRFLGMVQTPDSKGYVVKPGTEIGINHGRVHEITDHSISVEEEYTEIGGEKKKRTIVLSLHPPEEGQL